MLVIGFVFLGIGCHKTVGDEDNATKKRSDDFQASVQTHKYKLAAFYADKPIDYITSDAEVRAETDLWAYVKGHITDDENFFGANGTLTIYQKANKISGNEAETINATYSIVPKGTDVSVTFIDYMYSPLEYKLLEFDNAYFTVYVDGPSGSKLYSKYARVE